MGALLSSLRALKKTTMLDSTSPIFGLNFANESKRREKEGVIAKVMSKEVDLYLKTTFPSIVEVGTRVKMEIDKALKDHSYHPTIKTFAMPEFISSILDLDINAPGKTRELRLSLDTEVDVEAALKNADPENDKDVQYKKYLMGFTSNEIERAYIIFISDISMNVSYKLDQTGDIEALYIAIAFIYFLNKGESLGRGDLDDYRYYMEVKNLIMLKTAIMKTRALVSKEKSGYIILTKSFDESGKRLAIVSEKAMTTFYENGGEIEVLYGAIFSTYASITVDALNENALSYDKAWKEKKLLFEIELNSKRKDIALSIYKKVIISVPDITMRMPLHTFSIQLNSYLNGKTVEELFTIIECVEGYVLDVVYRNTNARYFSDKMKFYTKNTEDKETALTMVVADMVVKYLSKGLTLIDK